MSTAPKKSSTCTSSDAIVHLDVIDGSTGLPQGIRKSRSTPKRAAVLIAVQLLIIAHIALWLLSKEYGWFGGKTLTPVEPSEAMQTLEKGFLNAGFVFFLLALLSTLIFGRFFCGWACHIVMLQDFCGWLMKKMGVKPKPFRSRVLIWVPLLIALYMFVWPSFKRLAIVPILRAHWPEGLALFRPLPEFAFENHLVSEFFWSNPEANVTFPIIMAVPTLMIVGFAAVYLLGAKGFCTYGCPYGGFFAPLDELSPLRVRVTDDCEQCGHCTARCTSNVRVHEEVREYGMVVDPGCMKCMDCISVCPNDALYLGFGKPAVRKGPAKRKEPKRQYDLSLSEDIAIGAIFIGALFAVRGMYLGEGVPFLMAVAVGGLFAFLAFKSWRVLSSRQEIVKLQNLRLKWRGSIQPAGWVVLAITLVLTGLLAQNSIVNWSVFRAQHGERLFPDIPREAALSPFHDEVVPPPLRAEAERIGAHYARALGVADGGFAIMTNPDHLLRLYQWRIISGDFADAERIARLYLERIGAAEQVSVDVVKLILLQGRFDDAYEYSRSVLVNYPESEQVGQLEQLIEAARENDLGK